MGDVADFAQRAKDRKEFESGKDVGNRLVRCLLSCLEDGIVSREDLPAHVMGFTAGALLGMGLSPEQIGERLTVYAREILTLTEGGCDEAAFHRHMAKKRKESENGA